MKTFKEFLSEIEVETINGAFVGVSVVDVHIVQSICRKYDIELYSEPHVTLIYSKEASDMPAINANGSYTAKITGAAIYGPNSDCLVLTLSSLELRQRHEELVSTGLVHSYPNYSPHITLSYNWKGPAPDVSEWVGLTVRLQGEYFNELN